MKRKVQIPHTALHASPILSICTEWGPGTIIGVFAGVCSPQPPVSYFVPWLDHFLVYFLDAKRVVFIFFSLRQEGYREPEWGACSCTAEIRLHSWKGEVSPWRGAPSRGESLGGCQWLLWPPPPPSPAPRQEEFCLRLDRESDRVPEREAPGGGGPSDAAAFGTSHSYPGPHPSPAVHQGHPGAFPPVYVTSSLRAGKSGLGCDPGVGATPWFGV